MSHRITILCDNSVGPLSGTLGEHGFAALVEGAGEETILFDTGQGATLLHNAQRMNRDLHRVTRVVLSHGHYDHTGGLWPFLQAVGGRHILAHPGVFSPRYRVKDTGEHISIGIPYAEEFLRGLGARFELDAGFRPIAPGVHLTGEVPRRHRFETGDCGLCCDSAGCLPDPLADDQSLVLTTPRGLVLLLGCCHAGLVNTIDLARERTGEERVQAVIGGTHLGFASPLQLEETIRALRELGVKRIFGSHCTGFSAAARFAREFPGVYHPAQVGFTLEL
jgi:7,8-dihydropterin-6-yl-methyl-4-(beta-D-ribofuranosyl)aminobenzene 5'-phosphate synthase